MRLATRTQETRVALVDTGWVAGTSRVMEQFLANHASALFALAGTVAGGAISAIGAWLLAKRELRLRLSEKLLDRRIDAHEKVLGLCKTMRTMASLDRLEAQSEVARTPVPLASREVFHDWQVDLARVVSESSHWLRNPLVRELSLVQDYTVSLHMTLLPLAPEKYAEVGAIVRQDFVTFSGRLEELALEFFSSDLHRLRLVPARRWHKYERRETEAKLQKTLLWSRWPEIEQVILNNPVKGPAAQHGPAADTTGSGAL